MAYETYTDKSNVQTIKTPMVHNASVCQSSGSMVAGKVRTGVTPSAENRVQLNSAAIKVQLHLELPVAERVQCASLTHYGDRSSDNHR